MGFCAAPSDYVAPAGNMRELDLGSLADLVACMEIAAYSLARSGENAAANIMFCAVAELEKTKTNRQNRPATRGPVQHAGRV